MLSLTELLQKIYVNFFTALFRAFLKLYYVFGVLFLKLYYVFGALFLKKRILLKAF